MPLRTLPRRTAPVAVTRATMALAAMALATMALAFAARPAVAQQAPASPRDSVKATIAGAAITVDYGRPSKRGREIFGALVPWGVEWRTGANQATTFTTSKPLAFGALAVPAGTYTLYTLPQQDGRWMLIISRKTGQWGIPYPKGEDLGRVPMVVEQTPAVVEQMTIAVAQAGAGGALSVTWDRTKATAAFTVK